MISKNITGRNGLPSSEVYCTVEDDDGYLWVGTDNGLARYDGKEFEIFTTKNGLPDNSVLRLVKDYDGKIWVTTLSDQLIYIERGKIFTYPYKLITPEGGASLKIPIYAGEDSSGRKWIEDMRHRTTLYAQNDSGVFVRYNHKHIDPTKSNVAYRVVLNKGKITAQRAESSEVDIDSFRCRNEGDHLILEGPFKLNNVSQHYFRFIKLRNGDIYGVNGGGDFIVFKSGRYYTFGNDQRLKGFVHLYEDKSGNLWVTGRQGAFLYLAASFDIPPSHHFRDNFITSTTQDAEGNLWFTDHNKGLHIVPNQSIRKLRITGSDVPKRISRMKVRQGSLWFSTVNGEVWQMRENQEIKLVYQDQRLPYDCYPFEVLKDEKLLIAGGVVVSSKGQTPAHDYYLYRRDKVMNQFGDQIYMCTSNGIVGYDSLGSVNFLSHSKHTGPKTLAGSHLEFNIRTNATWKDGSKLWLGSIDGLYVLDDSLKKANSADSRYNARVMALQKIGSNLLVIGTKGEGLLLYNTSDQSTTQLTRTNGLPSDMIQCLFVKNNTLLVGTNQGMTMIRFNGQSISSLTNFTLDNGLLSNEISAIQYFQGYLYIGTSEGICCVPMEKLVRNNRPPPIFISSHTATSDGTDSLSFFVSPKNRNLVIHYSGVGFRAGEKIQYKYIFKDEDQDTVFTDGNTARYTNLKPGNNTFYVWAKNEDGIWSNAPAQLTIDVPKKFTETILFFVLLILLVVAIIVGIVVFQNKRRQVKVDLLLQTAELKQQALAALMNPHFIYNSLSAIQNYINTKDIQSANKYLSRFGKLIRQNLNSAREGQVYLEDEMERLQLYLEIEKMRFGDRLTYTIITQGDFQDNDYVIPSMILQPFVENAIWHGILPKETDGHISINFTIKSDEYLDVIIEDDGLGFDMTKSNTNEKHHTSLSSKITKERLDLLSQKTGKKFSMDIKKGTNNVGARVELRIPLL